MKKATRDIVKEAEGTLKERGFQKESFKKELVASTKMGRSQAYSGGAEKSETRYRKGEVSARIVARMPKYGDHTVGVYMEGPWKETLGKVEHGQPSEALKKSDQAAAAQNVVKARHEASNLSVDPRHAAMDRMHERAKVGHEMREDMRSNPRAYGNVSGGGARVNEGGPFGDNPRGGLSQAQRNTESDHAARQARHPAGSTKGGQWR
jgi:hypothetical protein